MTFLSGQTVSWLSNALAFAAQAETGGGDAAPSAPGGAQPNPLTSMLPMLLALGVFFWLIVLRPQKKERQQRQQMLDALKKGDRVITIGGIHGKVDAIDEAAKTVTVEVAQKVYVKFSRAAVQTIEPRGAKSDDKEKGGAEAAK